MSALHDDNPPIKTLTFLFTDIQGSTRLWEQHPDAMRAALARHDTLLRHSIEQHGGHVFKTAGDAFHAAFAQPRSALAAVLQAQTALHAQPWPLPEGEALRVRAALHAGEAEQRGGDYFGAPLGRTARLLGAAHGGQTLLSETLASLLPPVLESGAVLRSLGRHRLKDLAQPQEIFQLAHPSLPDAFPPLRSLEAFTHNLPSQLSSFIGREQEIGAARRLLGETRLLTLTGTGGAGKTRLALQVAAEVIEDYPDGVWLIEMAPLSDPALLPQAVASVLGIGEEGGERTLVQTLTDALRARSLLLVWDNCEHLVDACAHLAETLLRACPGLRLLATSREALAIGGEAVLPLSSLALPPGPPPPPTEALAAYASVSLFVDRAMVALPAFRLSDSNAAAVAQVCARLDGIPLALELAAARVRVLTPEQIAGRLDDRFRLLSGGSRTALPRQQTLRALIDWSYDLLPPAEKALLRRLSVFAGGWDLEAAEAVCAGEEVEDWEILDLLSRLVAKSLVVVEPPNAGRVRYRLLENLRSYARERLVESSEAEGLTVRHRDWFVALAEEAEPHLSGPEQASWLDRLERDMENLRVALRSAHQETGESLPRLAGALSRFWLGRSYLSEGLGWLEDALAVLAPDPARAKVLNGAGMLSWSCGDYDKSRAFHLRDLDLRRALGDTRGIARALGNLGILASEQGEAAQANALYQESLASYRTLGDDGSIAHMLNNMGNLANVQKDYGRAESLLQEGLTLYRRLQDAAGAAAALHNLGDVFLRQGQPERAKLYFRDSLAAQQAAGNRQRTASTLIHLAEVAAAEGDSERACLLSAAADHILQSAGVPPLHQDTEYKPTLDKTRLALGEEDFQRIWARGQGLDLERAILFILDNYAGIVG